MPSQSVTNVANAIVNKINNLISSHNSNGNAHQDIRNSIPKIFYAACDCSEQNELIELECEDWNTEQGNIIYVRFNNVDNHDRTDVMILNINEEPIPVHNTIHDFYNITPLTLFRDAVVKFTCYFIDENRPIFLYEFPTLISELYNDVGLITSSSVPNASSTVPSADTTSGSVGTGTTWARSDHTHPKSSLYAESTHTHSDADITTLGFYTNLPQANYESPSQQQVNSAINSAIGSKEDNANKVTSLSSSSTDTQYPSAKAVYDAIFNLDTLDCINENFTILSLPQITFTHNGKPFDGSTLHILEGYDKGAYVDWGDGTPVETYELGDVLGHGYSDNVQEHTITIYGNILNLYDNSFKNYTGITSINIPSGVTSLGRSCFSGCTGLTSVTIPSSVTSLRHSCFLECTNLVDYQLYWETPPITWSSTLMPNNTDTYFTIPNGTTANYTAKSFPSEKLVERSE